jgi:hypothetical protein
MIYKFTSEKRSGEGYRSEKLLYFKNDYIGHYFETNKHSIKVRIKDKQYYSIFLIFKYHDK